MAVESSHTPPAGRSARSGAPTFLVVTLTGAGFLLLGFCAVLLSYSGIHQVAREGIDDAHLAGLPLSHLYPAIFTLLLLLAFAAAYVLRDAPRMRRSLVDALLLLLIALGAGASAMDSLGWRLFDPVGDVLFAALPLPAAAVGFFLWRGIAVHLRGRPPSPPSEPSWQPERPERSALRSTAPLPELADAPAHRPAGRPAREPAEEPPTEPLSARASEEPASSPPEEEESPPLTQTRAARSFPAATAAEPSGKADGGPAGEAAHPGKEPETAHTAASAPETAAEEEAGGPEPEAAEEPVRSGHRERPELPRRTPGESDIAKVVRKPGPGASAALPETADGGSGRSAAAPIDLEDAFVPDPPPEDDPAADEALAGEDPQQVPTGTADAAEAIRRRPMVRRPRHPGPAGVPPEPPSGRVRSQPVPPQE